MAYRAGDVRPPHALQSDPTETAQVAALKDQPVLSAPAIYFTLKALRNVVRPVDEIGWNQFAGQQHIAWKTGTSYGHRDAWAIGLNGHYCVAVWTGNASGEGRPGLTGTLAAAPLLFDLFNLLPMSAAAEPPYDAMVRTAVCRSSGFRTGLDCPVADTVWITPEGMRTPVCPYHVRIHLDSTGTYRVAGGQGISTAWFTLPPGMEHYYAARNPGYRPLPHWLPGTNGLDEPMEILYPEPSATILIPVELDGSKGHMVVEVAHRNSAATLFWDLDGTFIGTTTGEHRMALSPPPGPHRLTLTDGQGHVLQRNFTIVTGASKAAAFHAP